MLTRSGNWEGPGHGLKVPETTELPLAVGVMDETNETCCAVLVVPALSNATRVGWNMLSVSAKEYIVCWLAEALTPLLTPAFSMVWDVGRVQALSGASFVEEEFAPFCQEYSDVLQYVARGTPRLDLEKTMVCTNQRARDMTLAFYVGYVAPVLSDEDRHGWMNLERVLLLRTLPSTGTSVLPSLQQWLLSFSDSPESAPPLDVPMNATLALAADHAIALAKAVPDPPPPVPENLVELVALMKNALRLPEPPRSKTTKARASVTGGRPLYTGDAPDLEDLVAHLPPCMKTILAQGHQQNAGRYVVSNFLVNIGFRKLEDIHRLAEFVQKDGESVHDFASAMKRAIRQNGEKQHECKDVAFWPKFVSELGGRSPCPYFDKYLGHRCASDAGADGGPFMYPSDYVAFSRGRGDM